MRSRPAVADEGGWPERLVVDQLPVVVWATDADLRFTMSFGGGLAALGLEPGQVVGVSLCEFFHTDDIAFPPIAAHRQALSGVEGQYETTWRGRTYDSRVWPERDPDGQIVGVVGFALDVTERREAEALARETEERYRTLVERLPGAVYVAEPGADGHFFFMSPQIEPMTGSPPQAWLDDPGLWARQLHPDDRERVLANEERASSRGEGLTAEYRFVCADGSVIWVEDEAQSILGEDGAVLFWGNMYDVTERKRSEVALRAAEARFRMLVEAGPGVVYVHDHGFPPALTYVSPQVTDLLGFPPEACVKDPAFWVGRIHRDDRKRVLRETESAIRGREPLVQEYRLVASDGREGWVQDRATSVSDEDGAPLLRQGLLIDISTRRRAEEDRRRALESQLALANRLEAIHELDRSLLSAASADEMADAALDRLRFLIPCDRAAVRFYEPERRTLVLVRAWERDGVHLQIPAEIELADEESVRLMQRELFLVQDLRELGELPAALRPLAAAGVRSGIGVPLVSEGEYLGYLTILSVSPGRFDERHTDVAREIAAALAIGVRETRLRGALRARADQLAQLAEERRQLLRRIVRAQEEERGRVALEIHDGIGQVLTSISLFASDLEQDVRDELRPRAARLSELVRRAISDSRQLVWSLRPPELERLGLVPALLRLVEDASAGGEGGGDLHEDIGDLRLAPDTEAGVYRVVQVAVNNAQKHARASSVSVVLRRDVGALAVVVEDDGRGFDPDAIAPGRGIGVIGMRERAELVDGALVVESRKGGGPRVRLEVPVDATEGPRDGS